MNLFDAAWLLEADVGSFIQAKMTFSGANFSEGYWCDGAFDWIIYASHESSITIGGWLLPEIKKVWSNWKEGLWTTPFSTNRKHTYRAI